MANHYATLGVERDASRREIVQAYRRQARRHHPDVGGDPARFLEVQQAYEILADPQARVHYDVRHAPQPPRRQPAPPPPPAPHVSHVRYATPVAATLPLPSVASCQAAIALGLGTFVVPGGAALVAHRSHGNVGLLVLALFAALALGEAARGLADNASDRARRHRQLWEYGYVLPELDDRECVERCSNLAHAARQCAGWGLAGTVILMFVFFAVLVQTSAP